MNLYRHRVWSCKSTGKNNLTYEEALVSEKKAAEEVQKFPEELMAPVLRDVQFSTLIHFLSCLCVTLNLNIGITEFVFVPN